VVNTRDTHSHPQYTVVFASGLCRTPHTERAVRTSATLPSRTPLPMLTAASRFLRTLFADTRPSTNRRRVSQRPTSYASTEQLEDRCLFSAGELDPTFGDGGIVITNVADKHYQLNVADMEILDDGSMLMVGTTTQYQRYDLNEDIYVVRVLPNGSGEATGPYDQTFGDAGRVRLYAGIGHDMAGAMGVLPDGKILIAGSSENDESFQTNLWRLNPNGPPDTTFGGGDGFVQLEDGFRDVTDLVVQSNGRVIVVGSYARIFSEQYQSCRTFEEFEMVGFTADGALDVTFADNGRSSSGSAVRDRTF
jgi:uncharacterized delta-60 repeat protein